ncbi:hypothetical protein [Paucihalobacter sp.]|uniref:hypothetical protein n=1 Tax=Paucihalobacter sp. TaxID=2850405 RepID=UPI002FE16D12
MKKLILMIAVVFSVSVAFVSCRETTNEVKVETEESKGAIERAGEKVDTEVNKEIDKAIDKIGDDN